MILLPVETFRRKQNHADSLSRKPFFAKKARDRGQFRQETKYDGQSRQEAKIGALGYTLSSSLQCMHLLTGTYKRMVIVPVSATEQIPRQNNGALVPG